MPTLPAAGYAYAPFPSSSPSTAAPQGYQRISSSPADFGAQEGQALSQLGATLERAGTSLADQYVREQEMWNVASAQRAENIFNTRSNAIYYGDAATGEVGFLSKRGQDAAAAWPVVSKQLNDLRDEARKGLYNEPQRIRFDAAINDTLNRKLAQASTHYNNELKQWNADEGKAKVQIAAQTADAAIAAGDIASFDAETAKGVAAVEAGLRQTEATPAQIQAATTSFRQDRAVTFARTLADKDPIKARDFVEMNGALLGDKKAALLDHVRVRANEQEARRLSSDSGGGRGNINYGATGALGDPREAGWEAKNLTTIASPGGAQFKVHKAAAPAFQGLVNDLEGMGYVIKPGTSGGHNLRNRTGSSELSEHAYGTAIDINSDVNLYTRDGKKVTDLPPEVGELARKHGLIWGGNWKDPVDTMHFQWAGPGGTEPAPDKVDSVNVRANNFGGIRRQGVSASASSGGFETYPSAEAGVKAVTANLNRYAAGGVVTAMNTTGAPLNTLRGIVTTWAPPNENNTEELISRAVKNTGFAADQTLDMKNPDTLSRVTEAIIRNENGDKLPVARSVIEKAVADSTPGKNSLASRLEYIDKSNAPPEVKELARARVKSEMQDIRVNEQYQRQIQTQADKDFDEALEQSFDKRIGRDPTLTAQSIMDAPWKDPTARRRQVQFFEAQTKADPDHNTNNNNSIELFRRITLPEGDPQGIRTREPLDQALISKQITRPTYDKLRSDLKEEVVGGGQAEINKNVSASLAASRPFIRPYASWGKEMEDYQDKDAATREANYMRWVQDRVKAQIDSGKDWRQLFRPTINGNPNPDYVRSPENLAEFKPQESQVRNGAKDTPAQRQQAADDFTTKAGIARALAAGRINRAQAVEKARALGFDVVDEPPLSVPVR